MESKSHREGIGITGMFGKGHMRATVFLIMLLMAVVITLIINGQTWYAVTTLVITTAILVLRILRPATLLVEQNNDLSMRLALIQSCSDSTHNPTEQVIQRVDHETEQLRNEITQIKNILLLLN